jgi:hypothetical protein
MMNLRHCFLSLGLGVLAATTTGCATDSYLAGNHWRSTSIAPRFVYAITGYRPEPGTTYRDFAWREKLDINWTFQRHFLNRNHENPFQPEHLWYEDYVFQNYGKEPMPVSIWPQPLNYFHLTSVVTGGVISAVTTSATFIPIPVDSLIGLFERGGAEDFMAGVTGDYKNTTSRHTRRTPAPVDEFRLAQEETPEFIDLN